MLIYNYENPCYKCEKREPGCHGTCENYKKWVEEDKKTKEIIAFNRNRQKNDPLLSIKTPAAINRIEKRRHR